MCDIYITFIYCSFFKNLYGGIMRVISGKYKGKKIDGFDIVGTRPTMDRVKESLFGMIQNNIKDSICLDLFAGTGSLGIEALSNGANSCYFVDNGEVAYKTLIRNLSWVNDEVFLYKLGYQEALTNFYQKGIQFDIIFLDPPYSLNLISDALNMIKDYNLLKDDGIIICEYELENIKTDFIPIKEKKYGSTYIKIYKHNK